MTQSICGAECAVCEMRENCKGCAETNGCPFGTACFIAELFRKGGKEGFQSLKRTLIEEFNSLGIPGLPRVESLNALQGSYVNLAYPLPGGERVCLLDDRAVYLGNQLESTLDGGRCYGIIAAPEFLLVCTYAENGSDPELVLYKKRSASLL